MTDKKEERFRFVLSFFKVIRIVNGVAYCICPSHSDNKPSLHISMGDKKIVLDCKARCSFHEILERVGLKPCQLYYDYSENSQNDKLYVSKRQYYLEHYSVDRYDSQNICTGEYTHTKYRTKGKNGEKQFSQGHYKDGIWIDGLGGVDTSLSVFCNGHIIELKQALTDKTLVCYCEGEKDAKILWKYGFISFTCGAVRTFHESLLPYLKGGKFVVFADRDTPGIKDAEHITALLNTVGTAAMIIPPVPEKGDISDFMEFHSKEDLQNLIDDAMNSSVKETVGQTEKPKQTLVDKLIELKAAERFATNDKGGAELFATVFKNVSRYNPIRKDYMYFNGIKWEPDVEGMKARKNAKKLADALLSYAVRVDSLDEKQRQDYLKYASRLMNYRDRNTMVNDSKDLNYFGNEDLDKDDYILNCLNCVLDLSGDLPKVLSHDADLLLSKVCNANYDPAATCDLWKKTVSEIMEDDTGKIEYLQKVFGVALTGCTAEEELYFFYGGSTRNGKSTITETVLSILADYGATISPETLAVKTNKDSRTASPDIAKLAGARLVIASEPPKKMLFDTSLVKTLTGRDRVTARFLHQNEFTFTPKFKLILNTNYLPVVGDGTIFKSERIRVINFNKHFEEDEQNKHLKDELKKESDGILNWMIEGLLLYRREGLKPPTAIRDATKEYEADSDKIGRFISECLEPSDKNVSAKMAYESYSKWCSDSGIGIDGRNNFYTELKIKGIFAASGTVNGKTVRNIIRGYELADGDFIEIDDNTLTPFD